MKIEIPTTKEIDIRFVKIILPMRYGDEDVPYAFPLRTGDIWEALIDTDTGRIQNWPRGQSGRMATKVCDAGIYILLDADGREIARREDYVPHSLIPGKYGDYVDLNIDADGTIACFGTGGRQDVLREFFKTGDDDDE